MRSRLTLVWLAALGALLPAWIAAQEGAEATVSRSYALSGFDNVSVIGPHHVTISVGPSYSIQAEGPQQTFDDTEIEVEDGRLTIHPVEDDRWERRRRASGDREFWDSYKPATFHITLPALAAVSLIGGGDMRVDRVERGEFSATVGGAGDLDVAVLRVEDARFTIAGAGDLVARGSARRSRVSIAGAGNLQARAVTSDEASISIAGSGNVALTVEQDARISMVGGGDVDITGPARCSVSRMGGGRVRCGGDNVVG